MLSGYLSYYSTKLCNWLSPSISGTEAPPRKPTLSVICDTSNFGESGSVVYYIRHMRESSKLPAGKRDWVISGTL